MELTAIVSQFVNFTTVFLGIFIEAVPFLLMGTFASGLVEVFVRREDLMALIPRSRFLAPLIGGLMGFAFPVCECGVIPLTRRLYRKGLPLSAGIAFLLAAPIINPVVMASTFAAYGFGVMLLARLGFGLLVALIVGLLFSMADSPTRVMLPEAMAPIMGGAGDSVPLVALEQRVPFQAQLKRALKIAGDEFFEMGRYLILGSLLAALMQTVVPQSMLLSVGSGPFTSVVAMQALAYVLSVCSTVDAFVSLAFINTFTTGSVLAFLVFGPMVDIKSTLMFLGVFRRKYVVYLVLLPFLLTLLMGVFLNLNVSW
jgi:uncharacterized membrane protein YraQ (UPF0718 family)